MNALQQIGLSKTAFRDIDPDKLDAERDAAFIIQKVAERGLWQDVVHMMKSYPHSQIKQTLLDAAYLPDDVTNFFAHYFSLPLEQFRCYKRKQSLPQLWHY